MNENVIALFNHLAEFLPRDKKPYDYVQENCGIDGKDNFEKALIFLCTKGLIKIDYHPSSSMGIGDTEYIIRTDSFYEALDLGLEKWITEHDLKVERRKQKILDDSLISKYQKVAVRYWPVPILISLIALVVSTCNPVK